MGVSGEMVGGCVVPGSRLAFAAHPSYSPLQRNDGFQTMALSSAERQRAYRQRHLRDVEGSRARLNVIIEQDAVLALRRLAAHKGLTQAAALRELVLSAQNRVIGRMGGDAWDQYHAVTA